jgi:hypothetical protein
MVSTVPADLQNILMGTASRRNDQEWKWSNQNLYIEEEQTTQRPKEKVQKDKQ